MSKKNITIKVTSAFCVAGEIVLPGTLIEVPIDDAKDLLHRGKAELATEDDAHFVAPRPLAVGETVADDEAEDAPAPVTEDAPKAPANGRR